MTPIEICNTALTRLGSDGVLLSLDQSTKEARLCARQYRISRRSVFSAHYWRPLRTRAELTPLEEGPRFGYARAFQLPSDFLRQFLVMDVNGTPFREYRIEGQQILCNVNKAYILYIKDEEDTSKVPHYLCDVVAYHLARDLVYAITKKNTVRDSLQRDYEIAVRTAKSSDSQDDAQRSLEADEWLRARVAGYDGVDPGIFRFTTPS